MPRMSQALHLLLALFLLSLIGCGGSGLVPVTGKVTLDGKPLTSGNVAFHPSGTTPAAYGTIQSDGTYVALTGTGKGMMPGAYRITVEAFGEIPKTGFQEAETVPPSLVPEKYRVPTTSGLEYTVPADGGTFDVEMKSN